MKNDPWLGKWLPLLKQKSANGFILELGFGDGRDTSELIDAGCKVIATDLSTGNLAACKLTAPHADIIQLDHGQPLPFAPHSVDMILASLTLHYFTWTITLQIASELRRCLKTDGILLARFNSTNDVNHGSSSIDVIEPNYYHVGTINKRFFDEISVRKFLHDWDIQFLEENIIHRYEKPKSVWEVMAVCSSK